MQERALRLLLVAIQAFDRARLRALTACHPGLEIDPTASTNLAAARYELAPGARLRIGAGVVGERMPGALHFSLGPDARVEIEDRTEAELGRRGIYPNVDFYSGIVYNKLGIPTDLFTPIFAVSRVAGWTAHWLEQMRDNRLFRPTQVYMGGHSLPYVPIGDRKEEVATS